MRRDRWRRAIPPTVRKHPNRNRADRAHSRRLPFIFAVLQGIAAEPDTRQDGLSLAPGGRTAQHPGLTDNKLSQCAAATVAVSAVANDEAPPSAGFDTHAEAHELGVPHHVAPPRCGDRADARLCQMAPCPARAADLGHHLVITVGEIGGAHGNASAHIFLAFSLGWKPKERGGNHGNPAGAHS